MSESRVNRAFTALRKRAGLSMADMAALLGYRGSSSIQPYEESGSYDKDYLPESLIRRMRLKLVGLGNPPITDDDVVALGSGVLFKDIGSGGAGELKSKGAVRVLSENAVIAAMVALANGGYVDTDDAELFALRVIDVCEYLDRAQKAGTPEGYAALSYEFDRTLGK